jgi:hypothetical protein
MPSLNLGRVEQAQVLLLLLIEMQSSDGLPIIVVQQDAEIGLLVAGNDRTGTPPLGLV